MRDLGQILFAFGIIFTVMGVPLFLEAGRVEGAAGPVLMLVGGLMWLA